MNSAAKQYVNVFCHCRYRTLWSRNCIFIWPQKCLAVEMTCHVQTRLIFHSFGSCKHCSCTKVRILKVCFSSAVYASHMVDCGSLWGDIAFSEWTKWKDSHQRMFVVMSNSKWKKRRYIVETGLPSVYPTELKHHLVVYACEEQHLNWTRFGRGKHFLQSFEDQTKRVLQDTKKTFNEFYWFHLCKTRWFPEFSRTHHLEKWVRYPRLLWPPIPAWLFRVKGQRLLSLLNKTQLQSHGSNPLNASF